MEGFLARQVLVVGERAALSGLVEKAETTSIKAEEVGAEMVVAQMEPLSQP